MPYIILYIILCIILLFYTTIFLLYILLYIILLFAQEPDKRCSSLQSQDDLFVFLWMEGGLLKQIVV